MRVFRRIAVTLAIALSSAVFSHADERESARKLLESTMFNPEFRPKSFHGGEWFGDGGSYLALEPLSSGRGTEIVRYQTATGARDVFVPASGLIPFGGNKTLDIADYRFSADGYQVLIFPNSQTVWRKNTRGDYWIF